MRAEARDTMVKGRKGRRNRRKGQDRKARQMLAVWNCFVIIPAYTALFS